MHVPTCLLALVVVVAVYSVRGVSGIVLPRLEEDATVVPGCSGSLLVNRPPDPNSQPITITALFPFPDASGSSTPSAPANLHYLLPAATLALEEINQVMDGYYLQLDVRNTNCDSFTAIHELIQSKENTSHVVRAVLGPGCRDVTKPLSPLAHQLDLPQVSYANDTSVPVIASEEKKKDFPGHFQIVRNVHTTSKTALRVMGHFGWTEQVGFVYDDGAVYTRTVEELVTTKDDEYILSTDEVEIEVPEEAFIQLVESERDERIKNFMNYVREKEIRVIAGLVGEETACRLMCEAKNGVIPGDGFVWVLVGAYQEKWWKGATCPCKLVDSDIESVLLVSSQVKDTLSNGTLELGNTLKDLKTEYISRLRQWCPETNGTSPNTFFATTYDAVLALGLAINASLHSVQNASFFQLINNSLVNTDFTGASGHVRFNSTGERVGMDVVQQLQGGNPVIVGQFDSETNQLKIYNNTSWHGSSEVPPVRPKEDQKVVALPVVVFAVVGTIISNIFAIVVMCFVIRYRKHRLFLASGQRLNYFVFAGAYVAFGTIYLFALYESDVAPHMPHGLFTFFCILRLYLIMMGFTLTFGTLFVRAWRIYRIFNNPFVAKRKYTDTYLMAMVGVLLLIDITLVTVFIAVDRYGRYVSRGDVDYDTFTVCTYLGCLSKDYYVVGIGLISMYKVIQMLLFVFVVSLVRRGVIERKIYDDSQFLAIALYVTAICFFIGLPLQVLLLISFNPEWSLTVNMVWVNVATDATLSVVYIPKLYQIIYKKCDVRTLMSQKSKFYIYSSETRGTIL